jgi:hypothetical protein
MLLAPGEGEVAEGVGRVGGPVVPRLVFEALFLLVPFTLVLAERFERLSAWMPSCTSKSGAIRPLTPSAKSCCTMLRPFAAKVAGTASCGSQCVP